MLNGKHRGVGGKPYIAQYGLQNTVGGNEGGVECHEWFCLVHNLRMNKRISCTGQYVTDPPLLFRQLVFRVDPWPLQEIRSHQSCFALLNHPGIAPPTCIANMICNMIARRLRTIRLSLGFAFVCHTPYNLGNGNIV